MRAVFVAAAVTGVILVSLAAADWPQFLGPTRDGVAPKGKLARTWPAGGPKVLWTFELGMGFAGPAIRDGKVYVLDRVKDARDVLRCLDLAKGKQQWSFAYDAPGKLDHNGSRTTPAVDDKHVFIIGPFGHFHCVDKATHKAVWSKHLLDDFGGRRPNWGVAQSPLLYKKAVIVAPLGRKAGVVAYDRASGKELWRSRAVGRMAYVSPMVTTIDGVDQVVVVTTRRVVGLDAADGKVLWTYGGWRCNIPIPAPTAVGDGRLFITGGYNAGSAMIKVTREEGKFTATELFKIKPMGSQIHNALLHEKHLYVNCNTNSKRDGLVCFDLDGKVKWQQKRSPNFERGNLILADGLIYIMDGKAGVLRIVKPDPDKYTELARVKVLGGAKIWAPMAVSGGKLIIRDQRRMKCLEVKAESSKLKAEK